MEVYLKSLFKLLFLIVILLLEYVLSHSPNSLGQRYFQRPSCDMANIQKDLGRVCAVYKRSTEEYYVKPMVADHGQSGTGNGPNPNNANLDPQLANKSLLGYYYRAPASTVQETQPQLGYFFNAPFDFRTPPMYPGGTFYPPPDNAGYFQSPLPYMPAIPNQYLYYEYDGIGYPRSRDSFDDPFRRWRRQAVLRALAVKCCSSTGCSPLDFLVVDEEYKICDK